jgi:hypothetical protein
MPLQTTSTADIRVVVNIVGRLAMADFRASTVAMNRWG